MSNSCFRISATGFYAPPEVETAADLAAKVGRSEEWILARSGVARRHVSREEDVALLAARAAQQAIGEGPPPDLIINASAIPRQVLPDNSAFIQKELGLEGIPCFTVHATCLSFLVGLQVASSLLQSGYQRILIVSAELTSMGRIFEEPESSILVGDGAAAAIVEPPNGVGSRELLYWRMETWPEGLDFAQIKGGGSHRHPNRTDLDPSENLFAMEGPKLYRFAREKVGELLDHLFETCGISPDDIDLVVPHQASGPALAAIPRYGLAEEKVMNIVGEYGNCVAASMPMALHLALEEGRIKPGDKVLMLGTGAGLSVAAALLRW